MMKKSVLALAVLGAFAGVASAQSSVTLYGRADINVTNSKAGSNYNPLGAPAGPGGSPAAVARPAGPYNGDDVWRLDNGSDNSGIAGSRWGLRGIEDLGNGLRAYFVLESGFRLDTGAFGNSSKFFDRAAYVALASNSLGDVRLGRQESLTRVFNSTIADVTSLGEIKVDEVILVGGAVTTSNRPLFQTFGQRVDNTVTYATPSFGGFQVTGLVSLGEGVTAREQGAAATYKAGPIGVGVTYEEYHGFSTSYNKVISAGGNYNFGFAQLFAGYQHTSDFGAATAKPSGAVGSIDKYSAYNVGVLVPFGSLGVRAQYTRADYSFFGASDQNVSKYGISARYTLSKRTTLYSTFSQRSGDNKDRFAVKREITVLGLAHTF